MIPTPLQTTASRSARVRAMLARMTDGAVFELPVADLRDRFVNVEKVISWRKDNGTLDIRTWDESSDKGPTRWTIDTDGRLLDNGIATVWWIYDLRPTGENAIEYIMAALPDDEDDEDDEPMHGRVIPLRRSGS
jgi:hypothetical protein